MGSPRTSSVFPPQDRAAHHADGAGLTLVSAIAREVKRHRALGPDIGSASWIFELREPSGALAVYAITIEETGVSLQRGAGYRFGVPEARIRVATADLLGLARGELAAHDLLRQGRLVLQGPPALFAALAAPFRPGQSWWSVRASR